MTACMLSERRAVRPFGILGGGSAAAGVNLLLRADGRTINMGAKNIVHLAAGERLRILTPGNMSHTDPETLFKADTRHNEHLLLRCGGTLCGHQAGSAQKLSCAAVH